MNNQSPTASDYIVASGQYAQEREYWLRKLSGDQTRSVFPYDIRPGGGGKEARDTLSFAFDEGLLQRLLVVSNHSDVRLFVALLAGVATLLAKYDDRDFVQLGAPIYRQEVSGKLVNTVLPLRYAIDPAKPMKESLLEVSRGLYDANRHQNYPMETLLYKLGIPYSEGEDFPLFSTAVMLDSLHDPAYLDHLRLDCRFVFSRTDSGLRGTIVYNSRRYRKETIQRFAGQLTGLLARALADLNLPAGRLDILSSTERELLIHGFNDTKADAPLHSTLHRQFALQVEKTPDAVSLVCRDNHVTYRRLSSGARRTRTILRERGLGDSSIVAFMMPRSIEGVMAMIGILSCRCGFLALDPQYPPERIDYMAADSSVRFLVADSSLAEQARSLEITPLELVFFEAGDDGDPQTGDDEGCDAALPAYVIYTSGTTGRPKGVVVAHANIINTVSWFARRYEVGPGCHVLQLTDYTFDPSIEQIFASVLHGAAAYVAEKELLADTEALRDFLLKREIHIINFIPSVLDQLLANGPRLPRLRATLPGGQRLDDAVKDRLRERGYSVFNHYGPSETTVDALTYECGDGDVLLGGPIDNCRCYILDRNLALCPMGMAGEIYIGGSGVAAGYLNNPELTSQRFFDDPFFPGERLYRTGDLGRFLPEGAVQFLGRGDRQIKIKGYRIELGEIENRMMKLDGIREAVALDIVEESGNVFLAGYYTGDREYSDLELREWLSRELPVHMVPLYYIRLDAVPRNANGKVERRALPVPILQDSSQYQPPTTALECSLAALWAGVLEMDEAQVGRTANFFEIGGHSLNATVLIARIHKELGVKVPMVELFRTPTIKDLAVFIEGCAQESLPRLRPIEKRPFYPLSPAQQRLYILQLLDDTGIGYNLPSALEVKGELDEDRLQTAFRRLIHRHEILRTSFMVIEGKPAQVVHDEVEFALDSVEGGFDSFIRPFDPASAPLLRVALIREEAGRILALDMHHLVTDGVSMGILIREFLALYSGDERLPELSLQYKDVAQWQPDLKASSSYWHERFKDPPPPLELPLDCDRPQMQSFAGGTLFFYIDEPLTARLEAIAAASGVTLFMTLLAVFNLLLHRLCGQEDIVVGTPVSGRRHPDMEAIVGMFVNTLPLRNRLAADEPFEQFLRRVGTDTAAALDHQDYPFERLVEELDVIRDTGRNPLFDVMFSFEDFDLPRLRTAELELLPRSIGSRASKFDLTLAVSRQQGLECSFEYCSKLFTHDSIRRFGEYFVRVAGAVAADRNVRPQEIDIISKEERQWLLIECNDTNREFNLDKPIHVMFEEQARKTPEATALLAEDGRTVPYRQFYEASIVLARRLRERGLEAGDIVAIESERSFEMMTGIYAVLLAGGVYLPIDPDYPAQRREFMLADSDARMKLCAADLAGVLRPRQPLGTGDEAYLPRICGSDPAYVIFTSGSTGRPKGVIIEHGSLVNRLCWMQAQFPIGAGDVLLQKTPTVFDVSVWELFWWSFAGAALVVPEAGVEKDPSAMQKIIESFAVTVIHFVPSMLRVFLEVCPPDAGLETLKYVFSSGEALDFGHTQRFYTLFPNGRGPRLINLYGPTEATVDVSYYPCPGDGASRRVPIGRPVFNTRLYVLDARLQLQPTGVAGELCIAGNQLARGYLNRPELTHESFLPKEPGIGDRLYKTGDLCRVTNDGQIEFIGRLDHQLKIRGFRVETGEIEQWLQAHEAVREAVVVPGGGDGAERTLVAWITSGGEWDAANLKRYLAEKLPAYMIPTVFLPLDKVPRTPSGKIDRRSLAALSRTAASPVSEEPFAPPANPLQETIAEAWLEILEKDIIGVNDNFFDVGGNSLQIVRLAYRLELALKRKLPVATLFRFPTVASLAGFLEKNDAPANLPSATAVVPPAADAVKARDRLSARRRKG